ncbi:uncharacterized protein LOC141601008 [Silene latifolia]|uniref:uncharacterized protein LOC141601008 n=1 Tax=Silene latifolia TaxID=37657 RepID=UPI003D789C6F
MQAYPAQTKKVRGRKKQGNQPGGGQPASIKQNKRGKVFIVAVKCSGSAQKEWEVEKYEQAFRELKHYLSTPSLLSKPEQGEPLFLYVAVTEVAVSANLVREQDKEQRPVYYVSKSLLPAETRYEPRTAIKSHALEDFVSDFSLAIQNPTDKEILTLKGDKDIKVWQMHIDGASNQRRAGVGLILRYLHEDLIAQAVRCEFKATNNETEYEALILGMQLALELAIRNLQVYSESLLIVNHINDEYVAKDLKMIAYLKVANELKQKFKDCKLKQVPRDQNVEADALETPGATFKPT